MRNGWIESGGARHSLPFHPSVRHMPRRAPLSQASAGRPARGPHPPRASFGLRLAPHDRLESLGSPLTDEEMAKRLAGRRILLAEDEVIVALELALELEDHGAEVVGPAHSLTEALTLALDGGIDGAILDVDLQGEDVYPVAERLVASGVPFLFHTGHGSRTDLNARFGATVCIKPTLSETLVAQVAAFFD